MEADRRRFCSPTHIRRQPILPGKQLRQGRVESAYQESLEGQVPPDLPFSLLCCLVVSRGETGDTLCTRFSISSLCAAFFFFSFS